ncbi:hypothetical protein [Mesorhizobium sp. M0751]
MRALVRRWLAERHATVFSVVRRGFASVRRGDFR